MYVLCQSQIATPEKEVTCVTGVCVVRSSENVQRVGLRVAMVHAFEYVFATICDTGLVTRIAARSRYA